MHSLRSTTPWLLVSSLTLVFGCGDPQDNESTGEDTGSDTGAMTEPTTGDCTENEEVTEPIDGDTTWSCDKILGGIVYVNDGATLTISPGVTVRGKSGSALVVAQGGRLEAAGTQEAPIVFTSSQPEGSRAPGDWGGVVLLGKARTNLGGGVGQAEGLEDAASYGGDDAAYNCGTLKWVRVEFAGFELTTDNELNGVTFYSCGTGTTVDYLQVHMGQDDGVEWFGGGFDAKHLVISGAQDDSLDIDQGFNGTIQHVFIQQDPGVGNYCFEVSNQDINLDASPRTAPTICNATCIGTGSGNDTKSAGIKLKEGASGSLYNSALLNFKNGGVDLTEDATVMQAESGAIKITNDLFFQVGDPPYVVSDGSTFDLKAFVEDAANNNHIDVDPMLTSTTWTSANIQPQAGSPVLGAGGAASGCEATDYIGAVKDGTGDWTTGWTIWALN
jgi:hypothetical protein